MATKQAVLIDPVVETAERDAKIINELGLELVYMLNTHVHADHITGTGALKHKFFPKAKSVLGTEGNEAAKADIKVKHGEVLTVGNQVLEVRRTPGHTEGCVSYVWTERGDAAPLAAFTGDAVLIRACGRTDFQGGSPKTLYQSVWEQVLSLPDNTAIYPAHDYKGHMMSTVGEEKALNPRLTKTMPQFEEIMNTLNLPYPKKIDASLPANRLDGEAPSAA